MFGVGPTTPNKVLTKMHDTDQEFFDDLFEAKVKDISTGPYWNEPMSKPKRH